MVSPAPAASRNSPPCARPRPSSIDRSGRGALARMGFHVTTERKRAIRVPKRAGTEKPAFLEHGVSIGKHDNSKDAYGERRKPGRVRTPFPICTIILCRPLDED